jgi:hypothetical protein
MTTTAIPWPVAPDAVFVAPPGWSVPAGFDPRRGHLPDPTWPPAPEGWEFWGAPARPGAGAGFVQSVGKGKLVGGGVLAVVAVLLVVAAFSGDDDAASTGVGSCWTEGQTNVAPVACGSDDAAYRVSRVVDTAGSCSGPAGYLVDGDDFLCLESMP